jgi:uncharacterized membrane protein
VNSTSLHLRLAPRIEKHRAGAAELGAGGPQSPGGLDKRPPRASSRLASIDRLRGLIIVIMALDHVRDYFTNVRFNPLDPAQTTVMLYATRWITNFCAPTFILLAGVSAYLVGRRSTTAQLSRFLLTRGLWLIVLELTVITVEWTFNFRWDRGPIMQVIWAIGLSMVVLSALVYLPVRVVGAIGVAICVFHNLLDGVPMPESPVLKTIWAVLHVETPLSIGLLRYPLLPWVGVMAAGYALGRVFEMTPERRHRLLVSLGAALFALFLGLRLINTYGDTVPWTTQSDAVTTLMSFLNVKKYPPSLDYLLATLGPALLMLAYLENMRGWFANVLQVYGRVPLFFYVLHLALAHFAAGVVAMAMGYGNAVLNNLPRDFPADWGVSLPLVYLAWILVVITLYPACRWFGDVKRRRGDWWLSYL